MKLSTSDTISSLLHLLISSNARSFNSKPLIPKKTMKTSKSLFPILLFFFVAALATSATARAPLVTSLTPSSSSSSSSSSSLVSDGVDRASSDEPQLILLRHSAAPEEEKTCEQSYGFLPCTTTVLGNLFLILVYGYLMFLAARYLSEGSELLLEILGPGIVGGLFLPILGALPDAMLILVSGISGTKEAAQRQVLVGMGLLAGSTVMLLTLLWGSCVVIGKTDLNGSIAIDSQDTKRFSLTGSGVSTDIWTSYAARIMTISVIPFIIVQLPQILHSSSGRHLAVLVGLIVAVVLLISYCLYQVFQPWIRRLLGDDGEPDENVLRKLFKAIDLNDDRQLSASELSALMIGIRFDEIDLDHDDAVQKVLRDFDTSGDAYIDENEFVIGISRWLNEAKRSLASTSLPGPRTSNFIDHFHLQTKQEHNLLGEQSDEVVENIDNPKWTSIKAVLLLLLGAAIAAAFADPLVDAVNNFSAVTSIPSFFISFIALPLATNSSEAVSALIFASRKKKRTSSLTFSEIYGAVTMNNVLCLSVFLALVYARGLVWDFSSEVLVILIVCIVMGLFGSFRTAFPLWTSSVAYVLYPFSLILVYVLDYKLGWS
ncbi:hypothetical protein Scep_011538 [Stephania cephalantha]|uniref:EF-hand domain-containing protein n=1 Tax=Stephania cephalantha TaxID=152367 RepID=A0AAP0P8E9_9MAGN